jgi:hypothetical protein
MFFLSIRQQTKIHEIQKDLRETIEGISNSPLSISPKFISMS